MGSSGEARKPQALKLQEGDVIQIAFPSAPSLNTTQQVRRDGRINLGVVGELVVVDKTVEDLSKEIAKLFESQLVSNEVNVTLVSSSFVVYVTGAVLRPGKVVTDRPITAFEAVMEAGGFDFAKANTKEVIVIREEDGKTTSFTVNLKKVLDGKNPDPFMLKKSDKVFVREKFSLF